ncbi:MAG: hypothetical protein ACO35Q_14395, partial [Prochlorothrix sp.]
MVQLQPSPTTPAATTALGQSRTMFLSEFLGNSGHFLILKSLSDIALYGWLSYFTDPIEYVLILAMVIQTLYLARPRSSRFFGNLMGVSLYTLVDLPMDGWGFFHNLSHWVFLVFSLAIAILQSYSTPSLNLNATAPILSPWERWTVPLE